MNIPKIAVIGAGNIGSRHLQALANVKTPLEIFIVEPNKDAFNVSLSRFLQIENSNIHSIKSTVIENLPKEIDLCIISTSSGSRFKILEEVTSIKTIKNLVLEKFLFTDEVSFFKAEEIIDKQKIKTWVNTTRRSFPFYKKLRDYLEDSKYVSMLVTGGKWGLACNGIHIFDLFSMLQGDNQDYTIDTGYLDNHLYESKRQGYIEFNGSIKIKNTDKGDAIFTCFSEEECPTVMSIHSDKGIFEIIESKDECIYRIPINNFEIATSKMEIMPTSIAMTGIYEDIINNGTCELPDYKNSMKLHLVFLKALLNKQNDITGDKGNKICLIT